MRKKYRELKEGNRMMNTQRSDSKKSRRQKIGIMKLLSAIKLLITV